MTSDLRYQNVLVTGATGFVGRHVVRELLSRGLTPVCLVRLPQKLYAQHPEVNPDRITAIGGGLSDRDALAEAAALCQAAVNLVGIILERPLRGRTFDRVHRRGTERILEALRLAGIRRYVHMSALGTGADAATGYHRTKWQAEVLVRASGLDWTILQPSLIHGPDGDFMRLMKRLVCGLLPPVMPYLGSGEARVQPVAVEDVSYCAVEALFRDETIRECFELGGPRVYTWKELFTACRTLMPGARRWKPMVSQPVAVANWIARLSGPPLALGELVFPSIGLFRIDTDQVKMSQEDNICDSRKAEQAFGLSLRRFDEQLVLYAERIK